MLVEPFMFTFVFDVDLGLFLCWQFFLIFVLQAGPDLGFDLLFYSLAVLFAVLVCAPGFQSLLLIPLVRLYSSSSLFVLYDEVRPSQLIPAAVRPSELISRPKPFPAWTFLPLLFRHRARSFRAWIPFCFPAAGVCSRSTFYSAPLLARVQWKASSSCRRFSLPSWSFDLGQPARAEAAPKGLDLVCSSSCFQGLHSRLQFCRASRASSA
jgi:hypothetical protein